jgi:hypothetical protein
MTSATAIHAESWFSRLVPGRGDKPYMPLETGARWSYFRTIDDTEGTIREGGDVEMTVTGREKFKRNDTGDYTPEYSVISVSDDTALPRKMYFLLEDGVLTHFGQPMFDFNAAQGETLNMGGFDRHEGAEFFGASTTTTYLGAEQVDVPAGTFKNCRKYRFERISFTMNDSDGGSKTSGSVGYFWFARGVGIVRMVFSDSRDDVSGPVHTLDLASYSMP